MKKINRVKLFVNNNIKSKQVEKIVIESFENHNIKIVEDDNFDLGIAIGGDGSFLRMVNESGFREDALYVGINAGTLGFAQDIGIDEVKDFITHLSQNEYTHEEIGIGNVTVTTKDREDTFKYLNEVVVREEELKSIRLDVYIDDVLLENYCGDGLLISTSFGSTAYNLSFGGSMVYNEFSTLQITPLAPMNNKSYHSLTNSLILPSTKIIEIVPDKRRNNTLVTVDGGNKFYTNVDKIRIGMSSTIKVIRKKDYNYIRKINDKFIK